MKQISFFPIKLSFADVDQIIDEQINEEIKKTIFLQLRVKMHACAST